MNKGISELEVFADSELHFSHKILLEPPYRITCISEALCEKLGYTRNEITQLFDNEYVRMVHPEDRDRYIEFVRKLENTEQKMALSYRLVKKNGDVILINDISFSHHKQDSRMYAFSMLADVTNEPSPVPKYPVNIPASAAPFGYIQCTCEKYPKVLYVNDLMWQNIDVTNAGPGWREFLKDNLFFMIPYMDRDKFRNYLDQAMTCTEPIKIMHQVIRSDSSLATVIGWLGTVIGSDGAKTFSIIYTDLNVSIKGSDSILSNSYFQALESAYNVIFEINTTLNTVECLFGRDTSDLGKLYDVRMTTESAANFWLNHYIVEEDRPGMRTYFDKLLSIDPDNLRDQPMQAEFRICWEDGIVYSFIAVAILHDNSSILLCCRDTANVQYSSMQAREIQASHRFRAFMDRYFVSKQNIRGAVIFQRNDDGTCNALYCTQRLLDLLNIREDQYLYHMIEGFPFEYLEETAINNGVTEFPQLAAGQIEQTSVTHHGNNFIATYSHLFDNIYGIFFTSGGTAGVIAGIPQKGIFARTFGHFDLFVDGSPVIFSNEKEKELMALLIDRNGGTISSTDALSYLWEDELITDRLRTRYRKLAMGLKKTLTQYGIEQILINHNGVRSVDTSKFTCDYYELLAGNMEYIQSFHNSYMVDYNWSENTLGTLWDYS